MKKTYAISAAVLSLLVGTSAVAQAQGNRQDRRGTTVTQAEQQQRVRDEQRRATVYQRQMDQQSRLAQQQAIALQAQKRTAQYQFQQQYAARLAQQRAQAQTARDYSHDPYMTTPQSYRYVVGGNTRLTNQYGADVLKQSVNYGYQQGFQAGQADRQDHWASNYRNSAAYRDANYGYAGSYVDQSDYNYYFRQGFQRGYDDGYNSRNQYGQSLNGTNMILGAVLAAILGLTLLR